MRTVSAAAGGRIAARTTKTGKGAQRIVASKRPDAPARFTQGVALGMIGVAVVAAFVAAYYGQIPLPVAVALAVLAILRLWIWRNAVKREQRDAGAGGSGSAR